jgi:hypothetical protein
MGSDSTISHLRADERMFTHDALLSSLRAQFRATNHPMRNNIDVSPPASYPALKKLAGLLPTLRVGALLLLALLPVTAQQLFPLHDVRPGLHGVGRTVFQGNRVEEFQVEILGLLENLTPKQTIILAKLSGGPLGETGVMQGMSGSPVYIDGKLVGAIALGFPFSKQAIAGIQPIEQMLADATFPAKPGTAPARGELGLLGNAPGDTPGPVIRITTPHSSDSLSTAHPDSRNLAVSGAPSFWPALGNLTEISTPLALSGFTPRTLQIFGSQFRKLGFEPQQGVSAGSPASQQYTGTVIPGSMISVELLTGDMVMSADGTVTYVNGNRVYAFGHRFLDGGTTELPFARADVVALLPTLNTSFKLSAAREWVGTMLSDRSSAIAGEIGRRAHMVPITISVHSAPSGTHDYHFEVVHDRLLTPFITQAAIFSTIDRTERTIGAGTLRLRGRIEWEGNVPPLDIRDIFVSDSGLAQQVSSDAVVPLGFVLGAGFSNLKMKSMSFDLEPVESKRLLHIAQVWASAHEIHPGDTLHVTTLLQGENGVELTRTAAYRIPVGAPLGTLNLTLSDAATLNSPDFAGLSQSQAQTPQELVQMINAFRGSQAAYLRVWRQEPAFTIAGPLPGGDLTDPPPSVMLVLADPSASANSNAAFTLTRGSSVEEIKLPVDGYAVMGAKTIQVEVKE